MIISFEIDLKIADKTLPIIWKHPNSQIKTPVLCHQTLLQLMDYVDEIKGIIIPGVIPQQIDYQVNYILDHLRLLDHDVLNKLPIGVTDTDSDDILEKLYDHDYGVMQFSKREIDSFDFEPIKDNELQKVISIIGNKKPDTEHHGLANEWGQYRLLTQLNLNGEFDDELNEIKQNLSEVRYFKKLLLNEKKESPINGIDSRFKLLLNNLRDKKLNVAIIDDKVKNGWDKAYGAIFQNSDVISFDHSTNNKFDTKTSSDFDLIILDLRLEEEVTHDDSEIFGIEKMSGIKLLREIKTCDPSVPVIMCTASNKSWSYDAAINAGADGFWTKESPDFGMSLDYRFNNTLDLLNVCVSVLEWSNKVRPVFKKIDTIIQFLNKNNQSNDSKEKLKQLGIIVSLENKRKLIASLLLREPSTYLEDTFGKTSLVFAFITIWSFRNDIISLVLLENNNGDIFVTIRGDKDKVFTKENRLYKLNQEVDQIVNSKNVNKLGDKYDPPKPNWHYDETTIIKYLVHKIFEPSASSVIKQLRELGNIRNNVDIIHGGVEKQNRVFDNDIKFSNIYKLLDIYFKILTNL